MLLDLAVNVAAALLGCAVGFYYGGLATRRILCHPPPPTGRPEGPAYLPPAFQPPVPAILIKPSITAEKPKEATSHTDPEVTKQEYRWSPGEIQAPYFKMDGGGGAEKPPSPCIGALTGSVLRLEGDLKDLSARVLDLEQDRAIGPFESEEEAKEERDHPAVIAEARAMLAKQKGADH